ncbi:MAG: MarR family transcriptional regulator [Tissierellia bacterium]|nr:MarR family transcriptional regulator [Tissierellia bacterium]
MSFDLKLENQLCFPVYALSRQIIKKYRPFLKEIDLTYTQYITMLVMWEKEKITSREIGKLLYLDSGTLTDVLRKLEDKNLIERKRNSKDNRNLDISITQKGRDLEQKAKDIPKKLFCELGLKESEAIELRELLKKSLNLITK